MGKDFIILDKHVQSLSEQQREKLYLDSSKGYTLISFQKLHVTEKGDDEGISFFEQFLVSDNKELIKLSYRIKYGTKTRSVKRLNDSEISQIIFKL